MKRNLILLVLFVPLVLAIIGGIDDKQGQNHRFVVSIQTLGNHICGGALVGDRFVLTAATCVKDKKPNDLVIAANATDLTDDRSIQKFTIDRIISKSAIGKDEVRDNIAVLRLAENYTTSAFIGPIPLQESDTEDWYRDCRFYGWGQKQIDEPNKLSNILQVGWSRMSRIDDCEKYNSDVDDDYNICTYDLKARVCNFDTGDPLVGYRTALWGIATKQFVCESIEGVGFFNAVFTRIYSHKDWIKKTVEENSDYNSSSERKAQITTTGISVLLIIAFNR